VRLTCLGQSGFVLYVDFLQLLLELLYPRRLALVPLDLIPRSGFIPRTSLAPPFLKLGAELSESLMKDDACGRYRNDQYNQASAVSSSCVVRSSPSAVPRALWTTASETVQKEDKGKSTLKVYQHQPDPDPILTHGSRMRVCGEFCVL
jgi:hypothetical protein